MVTLCSIYESLPNNIIGRKYLFVFLFLLFFRLEMVLHISILARNARVASSYLILYTWDGINH